MTHQDPLQHYPAASGGPAAADTEFEPTAVEINLLDIEQSKPRPAHAGTKSDEAQAEDALHEQALKANKSLRDLLPPGGTVWSLLDELYGVSARSDIQPPSKDQLDLAIKLRDWVIEVTAGADAAKMFKIVQSPEKSALLMRLLEGKPPLRRPPPTSCGYPNYSLIEEPASTLHPVNIAFSMHKLFVVIDQRPWRIVARNEPAAALQNLLRTGEPAFEPQVFASLIEHGPVWRVSCGNHWPDFDLLPSKAISVGRTDRLAEMDQPTYAQVTAGRWGPARALGAGAYAQLEMNCWALRKGPAWATPEHTGQGLYLEVPHHPLLRT